MSLDPSQGISRIWRTIRALASRSEALRTNLVTDVDSVKLRAIRYELVREDVPPVDISLKEVGMVDDPLDEPFSRSEFDSATESCQDRSAPGLKGITYEILRKFSDKMYSFVLFSFNCMFRDSSFPSLFERMVHRRLEHRAEHGNWVPDYQFGFRRGKSALDAVAVVSTDVSQAFGRGESVAAVSVDIKSAFNSVLPVVLAFHALNIEKIF